MDMAEHFRVQAAACRRLDSPMYASLLRRVAEDIDEGGVCCTVLSGHEHDSGPSALALRLAGSVHRLVLSNEAPELARYYPSVGGAWDAAAGWLAFEAVLRTRAEDVWRWLDNPPQTNEVGRAAALMGGLLRIGETIHLPIRLFELGSSAGLNLRADHFGYTDDAGSLFGDPTSALVLHEAWRGRPLLPWLGLSITERLGSDMRPVDVNNSGGRLTLRSYVWPDQRARLERLSAAFEEAARIPARVACQDAASFARELRLQRGRTTVLWHSVMWQYLSSADQDAITARVSELGASATDEMPFAHLSLEPTRRTPAARHEFLVVLQLWPTGARTIIGTSVAHGVPTVWE